jgi:AraC-like DNA-binding protein
MESMQEILQECGFTDTEAMNLLTGMEKELGSFSLRTISENLIQDTDSGTIRITKRAEPEYARLFALAGMNMHDYLRNRNTFFKAFRRANSLAFDRLIQSDHELPFLK